MRLLVLGGSVFLSRAVVRDALDRGHQVTCAARGVSGRVTEGARLVRWDRAEEPMPAELAEASYDAVVDVARHPARVRAAVEGLPGVHWVFVSTISVYADEATPGGTPESLPTLEPLDADEDPMTSPETYGAMKVACEQIVRAGAATATVARPGLIVGPGDPSGRFSYWPARLAAAAAGDAGDAVLAPGDPAARVQVIDVRDLAAWLVTLAERRDEGVYDATGPALSMAGLLAAVAAGVGAEPHWEWASDAFLEAQSVEPWSGPRSLPLWLPRPAYDGMLDHDVSASVAAGLTTRPLADTARDTAAWLRATPDAKITGLTMDEEREVLAALASGEAG